MIELIHVQGEETECLSVRSWCPANELLWKSLDDRSFWTANVHGLTIDYWSGMPKVGCLALRAHYAPHDNTEVIAQFPNQVIPARLVQRWLNSKGGPPPPPTGESWEGNRTTRWPRQANQAWAEEEEEEPPAGDNAEIELASTVRRSEPSHLDSVSVDRISFVTGTGLSQVPSVFTGEIMIGFQWAVAPEAFRTQ